jgi:hypothetical protein
VGQRCRYLHAYVLWLGVGGNTSKKMRQLTILLILISTWTTVYSQDSVSVIKFKDLTVEIKSLAPFDNKELKTVFTDKAEFMVDLGETLESSVIVIKTKKYKDIEIHQAIETSVTIMNEGPHCDLTNWKHYTSDWRKVKTLKSNTFQVTGYNNGESKQFPKVSIQEVMEAARKQCGEEWDKHIKDIKSIYDYPCDVGISRYFLKIKATDKVSGDKIEKAIVVLIPMGC